LCWNATLAGKVDLAILGAELTPDVTAPLADSAAGGYLFQLPFVGSSAFPRESVFFPTFSRNTCENEEEWGKNNFIVIVLFWYIYYNF
jgi:hypothetical protein